MASLFATVWALVAYPFRVARETLSNLTDVLAQATPEDLIPPWIWEQLTSTWAWVKIQFPRALGYRATPYEQMTASVVLAVMLVIVSIGFLTWVAPIFIFPFLFGAARLIPPVDRAWPLTASLGVIDPYDVARLRPVDRPPKVAAKRRAHRARLASITAFVVLLGLTVFAAFTAGSVVIAALATFVLFFMLRAALPAERIDTFVSDLLSGEAGVQWYEWLLDQWAALRRRLSR